MTGWATQRPDQAAYKQYHSNIGKYASNYGKPYIHPDLPMYVPNDGENCIRIVDPIELLELQVYFYDVFFHRNVGYQKDYFLCLLKHNIGPCAICESSSEELWNTNKDAAKALLPENRRLMWVLDLKNVAESNILKLWSAPRTLSDEILAQSRNPELDIIQEVSDPVTGVPVYYNRTGKGLTTKYTGVKLGTQPMPLGPEIAAQRFRFMDILIKPTYEEVYASFHMQETPPEAGEQQVPHTVGGSSPSAYETAPATAPAHEVGAAEAARMAKEQEMGETGATLEYDYSDIDRIQPDNKDCFRKKFDEYNECDACPDRELCSLPWPVKKTAKTPKPTPAAAGKTPKGAGSSGVNIPRAAPPENIPREPVGAVPPNAVAAAGNVPDNAEKIQSAQEKLRADIARRKNQS
jgi:hypothetical protein